MESDDDDTLEFDIEVVESSSSCSSLVASESVENLTANDVEDREKPEIKPSEELTPSPVCLSGIVKKSTGGDFVEELEEAEGRNEEDEDKAPQESVNEDESEPEVDADELTATEEQEAKKTTNLQINETEVSGSECPPTVCEAERIKSSSPAIEAQNQMTQVEDERLTVRPADLDFLQQGSASEKSSTDNPRDEIPLAHDNQRSEHSVEELKDNQLSERLAELNDDLTEEETNANIDEAKHDDNHGVEDDKNEATKEKPSDPTNVDEAPTILPPEKEVEKPEKLDTSNEEKTPAGDREGYISVVKDTTDGNCDLPAEIEEEQVGVEDPSVDLIEPQSQQQQQPDVGIEDVKGELEDTRIVVAEQEDAPTIDGDTRGGVRNAEESSRVPNDVEIRVEEMKINLKSIVEHAKSDRIEHSEVDAYDADLELEFDNEPQFEPRQVSVRQNCNLDEFYELGDELGRGRFGTVWRCEEKATGRKLAAKAIHMRRKEDREDVEREVKIMSMLQHKRLLQLYDAFDDGMSDMHLITELVEGGELFERIVDDDFELTEKKAAIFMRQICEGVDYMQKQQIVHLDMKPENILCLSKSGNRIKLIDFGLARQLDPNVPLRVMFGTPDFAAPEVLTYETVSLATDMWSVGVICYVLLSGLSPFMGNNDMETMANVTLAAYDFNDVSFEPISALAKDFIASLLVRDQIKRLGPGECLQHPWLQRGGIHLERSRRQSVVPFNASEIISPFANISLSSSLVSVFDRQTEDSPTTIGSKSPSSVTSPLDLVRLNKRNLKKYVVRRKWHKTVHAIMALGRMGANLKSRV